MNTILTFWYDRNSIYKTYHSIHGDVWKWTSRLLFDFVHVHKGRLNDQRLNDNLKKCILNELLTKICYSVNEKSRYTVIYLVLTLWVVSVWRLRSTFFWNASSHRSHANGFTPACFLIWVIRFDDWLNAFEQTRHWCGFSPEIEN